MNTRQPSLRFDHREIAVIFSLFVFVSLLMFTVGILVGKGLAQARYEGNLMIDRRLSQLNSSLQPPASDKQAGSSVTTSAMNGYGAETFKKEKSGTESAKERSIQAAALSAEPGPLKLIPQKPKDADFTGGLTEPIRGGTETDRVLKNPKLSAILEEEPKVHRTIAGKPPTSFTSGKFSVQVGSYPSEKEANERVDNLKKLGFPYAYFSVTELGGNKATWYRVWLGFYPDYESADDAGKILRDRGEVKQYLVRKSDSQG